MPTSSPPYTSTKPTPPAPPHSVKNPKPIEIAPAGDAAEASSTGVVVEGKTIPAKRNYVEGWQAGGEGIDEEMSGVKRAKTFRAGAKSDIMAKNKPDSPPSAPAPSSRTAKKAKRTPESANSAQAAQSSSPFTVHISLHFKRIFDPFGGPDRCKRVLKLKPKKGNRSSRLIGLGHQLDAGTSGRIYAAVPNIADEASVKVARTVIKLSDEKMKFEKMFLTKLDDGTEGAERVNKAYRYGTVERYFDESLKGLTDEKMFALGLKDGFDRFLELKREEPLIPALTALRTEVMTFGITESALAQVRIWVKDIRQAYQHLHAHRISHRDLKPENLLISSDPEHHIVLCDFGLSDHYGMDTCSGTPSNYSVEEVRRKVEDLLGKWVEAGFISEEDRVGLSREADGIVVLTPVTVLNDIGAWIYILSILVFYCLLLAHPGILKHPIITSPSLLDGSLPSTRSQAFDRIRTGIVHWNANGLNGLVARLEEAQDTEEVTSCPEIGAMIDDIVKLSKIVLAGKADVGMEEIEGCWKRFDELERRERTVSEALSIATDSTLADSG